MKNDAQHLQGVFFQLTIWADNAHMQYVIPQYLGSTQVLYIVSGFV